AFFALIREVGPVRAPLFTYVNPIVAIALGTVVLAEPLTPGLLVGFPIVLAGCWFAATGGRLRARAVDAAPHVWRTIAGLKDAAAQNHLQKCRRPSFGRARDAGTRHMLRPA